MTKSQASKLLFEGTRVTGIEFRKGNSMMTASAAKEVILSAGAINSPQILQCSGIGDGSHLQLLGIDVKKSLIGVGQNLQDHLQVRLVYKTSLPTLNDEVSNWFKKAMVGAQYIFTRTGPLTLAASQVAVFTRSHEKITRPDIQFHMQPLSADKPGEGVHPFSAFTSSVCQLRPHSRGYLKIKTPNPFEYPEIHPNYLSDQRDCEVAVNSIKVARKIAHAPALADVIKDEFVPGRQYQSDEELLEAARAHSQTIYHPVSTCKMGNDEVAVVDERLRVHGIQGLRVADASIMPNIISGNTNAPAIMIGEKAADMILEDNR